jgi:hypothetical protein
MLLNNGRWQEEEEEDKNWGPHVSDWERSCNEIYVFIYGFSWAQVVSIRIVWHFCGKRRIIMVCFKIGNSNGVSLKFKNYNGMIPKNPRV